MHVFPINETTSGENGNAVWETFKGCTVDTGGVAEFPAGFYAHPNEKHVHEHDEVFIVLSGEITVPITNGPTARAHTGDWVLVKADEEHHLTNHSTRPCVVMYLILKKGDAAAKRKA